MHRVSRFAPVVWLLPLLAAVAGESPRAAEPGAVQLVNLSRSTRCAEEDNIDLRLIQPGIVAFQLAAEPPSYLTPDLADQTAPDFSFCDMGSDPVFAAAPKTVLLYEGGGIRLVGHTFSGFWRPAVVPVRVGARAVAGLHLVQLIDTHGPRPVEVLVVYPADGYWRAKPLPPAGRADTAYGSSFLVGPVETAGRPLVRLRSIDFDPATLSFHLVFATGGKARLVVTEWSPAATRIAVHFTPALAGDQGFAALRSMYVTESVADVARVGWQSATADGGGGAGTWQDQPVLTPLAVRTTRVRFGRHQPSTHNTSAPDLVFDRFITAGPAPLPR